MSSLKKTKELYKVDHFEAVSLYCFDFKQQKRGIK